MHLKKYTVKDIQRYIRYRKGEKKYGEYVHCAADTSEAIFIQLQKSKAEYVLLGIPEDMGIQLNFGKKGATSAWTACLEMLLNTQHNTFNKGNKIYILGHLEVEKEMKAFHDLDLALKKDIKKAEKLVEQLDKEITYIISRIIALGKKPIVIGGGHNNAYGLIKGCALALNTAINVANFDAHSDFRKQERRHSGNGFSYAFFEGFLQKYYVFGLHENYTSGSIFNKFEKFGKQLRYISFETIAIQEKKSFLSYIHHALNFIKNKPFGVEIDCDAIANIPSSAMTPSGFTVHQTRQFVSLMGAHKNAQYLHICEAAPNPENAIEMQQIGKLIAYLITDFIKK